MESTLRDHLALCTEVLAVVERENQELRRPESTGPSDTGGRKEALLARLTQSLDRIRGCRMQWQKLDGAQRARAPGVSTLLQQNQDLIMKIIVLDRENEQWLLRKGLIPAGHLPAAARQRPHYVADLYRRRTTA